MKSFLILLFFLPLFSKAQRGYVTQVTYSELNSVDQKMQEFMKDKMSMSIAKTPVFGKEDGMQTLTTMYSKEGIFRTNYNPHIYFRYIVFDAGPDNTIIKSCQIYGDYGLVVDFYVRFWPTTINLDTIKRNRIAYSYYGQDKITLSLNPGNNTGKLSVFNTTIKSIAEYKNKAKEQKRYIDSLANAQTEIKQMQEESAAKKDSVRFLYDSLVDVATRNYGIQFSSSNSRSSDIKWLKWAIANKKDRLNSGTIQNSSDIDWLIVSLHQKMKIDPDDFFSSVFLFYIDKNGIITKVEYSGDERNFIDKYLPQINQISVGKKVIPLTEKNGTPHPSQIKCFIKFTNLGLVIRRDNNY